MLSFEPVSLQGGTEGTTNKVAAASESIEKDAIELGIISEVSDKRKNPSPKSKSYGDGEVDEKNTLLGLLEQVIPVDMDAGTNDVDQYATMKEVDELGFSMQEFRELDQKIRSADATQEEDQRFA